MKSFVSETNFLKYFLFLFLFTFPFQKLIYLPFFNYKVQISEIVFLFGILFIMAKKSFLYWLFNHKLNLIDKSVIVWILISFLNLLLNWNQTVQVEFIGQFYMILIYAVIKFYLVNLNSIELADRCFKLSMMLYYGICISLLTLTFLHYLGFINRSPFLYCADYPYFGEVYRLRAFTNEPVMLVSYLSLPYIIINAFALKFRSKKWILHLVISTLLLILTLGKSLPIILGVVLVFVVSSFYEKGLKKIFNTIFSLILIFISLFFSNFHLKSVNSSSNNYLNEAKYIDPDKLFSFSNYEVYGNWYWRQKINGIKIFELAPYFGVGGGNLINVIKEERKFLNFTNKFPASDPICTYTGVLSEYGLIGIIGLLFLFGSISLCYILFPNKTFELNIFLAVFTYLLLEGICTDIMNFKHLWVVIAIISTIFGNFNVKQYMGLQLQLGSK